MKNILYSIDIMKCSLEEGTSVQVTATIEVLRNSLCIGIFGIYLWN